MAKRLKKKFRIARAVAIAGITAAAVSIPAAAESINTNVNLDVYELSMTDTDPVSSLEARYLESKSDDGLELINIDPSQTEFNVEGLDTTKQGLQTVNVKMTVVTTDVDDKSLTTDYSEDVLVKMKLSKAPQLVLSEGDTTVYLGSEFNSGNYISRIADPSGIPPLLTVESNVDTNTEGDYVVTYTAKNKLGLSTTSTLNVHVEKSPEQIAQEQAAAEAAAQAQAQAEAEAAAAQAQAVAAAQAAAAAASSNATGSAVGSSIVSIARSWVGTGIYASGGSNPATGTDCSGFTQYVYAQAGIAIGRTAAGQASNGTYTDSPQPGDLALWSGHAAIYSGNGYIINAMNPYSGIQEIPISSIYGSGSFLGFYHVAGVE